jgi:uncharacterized membrane protein HdeD (DUF308 family)
MDTWILIYVVGLLLLMVGLILFVKKFPDNKNTSKSTYITGIIMPIPFAFFFGRTLTGIFPGLNFIDLGAYFVMGMIAGFFLVIYSISRKT